MFVYKYQSVLLVGLLALTPLEAATPPSDPAALAINALGIDPLTGALQKLGLTHAFDLPAGSANFDGIAPRSPGPALFISDIFHKTFLALDENGTEAAAATAVVMGVRSLPPLPERPKEIRVDRPFLFAIQHRPTGACLFLGRMINPVTPAP